LDVLEGAGAVSRDFSLHMLLSRLADAGAAADVPAAEMTYLVDLRNEDAAPSDAEVGGGAD
jgi:hypothetical protein